MGGARTVTVRGLIGSEKEEFFRDTRINEALQRHGFDVQVEKAGSREIATRFDLKQYDFAFPAGVLAAEKIRREQRINKFYTPFFTPIAVASWQPIAKTLAANGLAEAKGGYYLLKIEPLLEAIAAGKRWKELSDNPEYAVNKGILITSTDVRKSNSAVMYLALASYVANGNNVVQSEADIARIRPMLRALFLRQGFMEASSETPFEDYLVMGMGKAPLVVIYESQFVHQAVLQNSGIAQEMVLMYPEPTLFTKHILLPLSAGGERLGELLEQDPELQRLAVEHGFRTGNVAAFRQLTRDKGVAVAEALVNVIEAPGYEILERMIQLIEPGQ